MNHPALHTTPFRPASDRRWPFPSPLPVFEFESWPFVERGAALRVYPGEIVRISGGSARSRQALLLAAAGSGACGAGAGAGGDAGGRRVAQVFFGDTLPAAATVAASVALPLVRGGLPIDAALARARLELDGLGAADLSDRRPESLSAHERRLALLAAALAQRPALLVIEQAESQLEPVEVSSLRLALWYLASNHDACVVMTTDHPRLIASADRHLDLDRYAPLARAAA
ncbi:MAG: hypothetical protein KGN16_17405 [Burkholderiales bacterium]|nr:hypothetical protein [Burkholderiales bacterium]